MNRFHYCLVLMALLPHMVASAQRDDLRISPPDTSIYPSPAGAEIQSVDSIGDGRLDARTIVDGRFRLPHYLAEDRSFAALRHTPEQALVLEHYGSVFDSLPAWRLDIPVDEEQLSYSGAIGRDSSGQYRVVVLLEERDGITPTSRSDPRTPMQIRGTPMEHQ